MTQSDIQALVDMHAVYRMYDATGRLLYVGVTGNLGRRLDGHTEKRWFLLVDTIRLEWFPDRASAEESELAAIRDENPEYNLAGVVLELQRRRAATRAHRERLNDHLAAKYEAERPQDVMTVREAVYARVLRTGNVDTARKRIQRAGLQSVGQFKGAKLYRVDDLKRLAR